MDAVLDFELPKPARSTRPRWLVQAADNSDADDYGASSDRANQHGGCLARIAHRNNANHVGSVCDCTDWVAICTPYACKPRRDYSAVPAPRKRLAVGW
ncbi:hypothetical protein GCM10009648_34950 [Tsukamurella spumae]